MWITWSTNITLQPVENGGLKISLNLPSDLSKVFNVESDELKFRGDTAGYNQLDSVKTLFENEKTKWVNKMKNIPFGQVEKDLENNLANAARFVVPGGGAFTYKNPVFNDNADLMIEASYNI